MFLSRWIPRREGAGCATLRVDCGARAAASPSTVPSLARRRTALGIWWVGGIRAQNRALGYELKSNMVYGKDDDNNNEKQNGFSSTLQDPVSDRHALIHAEWEYAIDVWFCVLRHMVSQSDPWGTHSSVPQEIELVPTEHLVYLNSFDLKLGTDSLAHLRW